MKTLFITLLASLLTQSRSSSFRPSIRLSSFNSSSFSSSSSSSELSNQRLAITFDDDNDVGNIDYTNEIIDNDMRRIRNLLELEVSHIVPILCTISLIRIILCIMTPSASLQKTSELTSFQVNLRRLQMLI